MRNVQRKSAIARQVRAASIALAGLVTVVSLASCGGSSNNDTPPAPPAASNQPPASASSSVAGFIAYLKTLVVTMQDTVEPLDLTGFIAPVSDTTEPDPGV